MHFVHLIKIYLEQNVKDGLYAKIEGYASAVGEMLEKDINHLCIQLLNRTLKNETIKWKKEHCKRMLSVEISFLYWNQLTWSHTWQTIFKEK